MSSVRQAFDCHALVYDQVFSSTQIRSGVWEIADRFFSSGMRLLDLGCGTGDDAIHFAERGLNVTAIDLSPEMIAQFRLKLRGTIHCEVADMRTYRGPALFDAAFSNFGALNCVDGLDWLAAIPLTGGAHVVLTTMGRFYPVESAAFLLKGQPRRAFRRLGRSCEAVVEGVRFDVYYHGLREIRKALGRKFQLKHVQGVRSPQPPRSLASLDRWLSEHRATATCADHFVSVWQYRET